MEYYIGQILLLPYTFAPEQTLVCAGQVLPIGQFQALYALIGVMYGGDGKTNFVLPNLLGTEPIPNMKYCIVCNGTFPMRP